MLGCRPSKWLWGLIPLAVVVAGALFGARPDIERDLAQRTNTALDEAGLAWASAQLAGRDAVLQGYTFSSEARDRALSAINRIWGVRRVRDDASMVGSNEPYVWWALRRKNKIKLRGHVPTDEDRQTILGFVKASMPDLTIDDGMVLAAGAPESNEIWLGMVSFTLSQLGRLERGTARLEGTALSLQGQAAATASYRAIDTALSSKMPESLTLKSNKIKPPVIKDYDFTVKFNADSVKFDGFVPREEARAQILQRTKNLFPGARITDKMELASGAPDGWLWAITAALTQVHRLESGRVDIEGSEVSVEGTAPDKHTAEDVIQSIRNGLPEGYSSKEKVDFLEASDSASPPAKSKKRKSDRSRRHMPGHATPGRYAALSAFRQ